MGSFYDSDFYDSDFYEGDYYDGDYDYGNYTDIIAGLLNQTVESKMDTTPGNVVAILICVLGLIGNLMSIFVIIVLKEYKKTTLHLYVLQLAIADTVFLATIPFKIHQDNTQDWKFGVAACKGKETITYLNYYASIFFLMVMSLDRYIAVCHSFSPAMRRLRTTFSAWVVIAGVWVLSLLVCIPVIMYVQVSGNIELGCTCNYMFPGNDTEYGKEPFCRSLSYGYGESASGSGSGSGAVTATPYDVTTDMVTTEADNSSFDISDYLNGDSEDSIASSCHYYHEVGSGWYDFIYVNFAILFVLPVVVMVVTYTFIIRKMMKSEARTGTTRSSRRMETIRSTTNSEGGGKIVKKRKKSTNMSANKRITVMCTSLVVSFIALWLPFHAVHLAKINGIPYPPEKNHVCEHLTNLGTILGYLNSALNPYLYSFLGTNFVRRFRENLTRSARQTIRQSMPSTGNSHSQTNATRAVLFTKGKGSESGAYNVTLETRAGGASGGSGNKSNNTIEATPERK